MYEDLRQRAMDKGFREIVCNPCAGKGSRLRHVIPALPGQREDRACPSCNGSGRLWAYARSDYVLTDDQLATAT